MLCVTSNWLETVFLSTLSSGTVLIVSDISLVAFFCFCARGSPKKEKAKKNVKPRAQKKKGGVSSLGHFPRKRRTTRGLLLHSSARHFPAAASMQGILEDQRKKKDNSCDSMIHGCFFSINVVCFAV